MRRQSLSRVSGRLGEVRAEQIVAARGMTVLARNVVGGGGEIDLVALDGDVVVFIEVKTRTSPRAAPGRLAVDAAKRRRISRAALAYLARNGLMNRQARFDVLELQTGRETYIENAFAYCGPAF